MKHYISVLIFSLLVACGGNGPKAPPVENKNPVVTPDEESVVDPGGEHSCEPESNWSMEFPRGLPKHVSEFPLGKTYYLGKDNAVKFIYDDLSDDYIEVASSSVFGFECSVAEYGTTGRMIWRSDTGVFKDTLEVLFADIYVDDLKVVTTNAHLLGQGHGSLTSTPLVINPVLDELKFGKELIVVLRDRESENTEVLVIDLTGFKIDNPVIGCLDRV